MIVSASKFGRLCALLCVGLPFSATANSGNDAFIANGYLGAKAGWNHYHKGCESGASDCDKDDLGWGAQLGYQFSPNWAAELEYLDFGQAEATYPFTYPLGTYTGSQRGWALSARASLPLTEQVELFGKLGALYWQGKVEGPTPTRKDEGWALVAEVGLGYRLSQHWQLNLATQFGDGVGSDELGGSNLWLTTIGVQYRFGADRTRAVQPTPTPQPAPMVLPALHRELHFGFDSSELTDLSPLSDIIERLLRYPDAQVFIQGFADWTGRSQYNLSLSHRRAQAVADYLHSQGIDPDRIRIEDFGERLPVIDNATTEHRAQNRRVHLYIPGMEVDQ
ncbi:porin [Halomonas denitrificans]|nr:porin [Halomonas denitrificans]